MEKRKKYPSKYQTYPEGRICISYRQFKWNSVRICQIWCIVFFCQFMVSQQRQPPLRGFTHVHARGENYSAFFFENFKEFMFFSFLKSHCNARHNVKVTFLGGGRYGNSYKNMCKTNIT